MITKQELIDIMKEGWQPTGYYSVDFNANMVADKILERINEDLEVLDILKRTPFHIYKFGFSNNYMLHLDTDHSIPITEEEANLISKVLKVITKEWLKDDK